VRIRALPGTPEFLTQVSEVHANWKTTFEPIDPPGTVGHLVSRFKQSSRWGELKPATKVTYERAFDALAGIRQVNCAKLTRAAIIRIRDEALLERRGRWMANYSVTVLSVVFAYGYDSGLITDNPLKDRVRKVRDRSGMRRLANRPWTAAERTAVLAAAPPHVRLPLALAMCTALRKADVFAAEMDAIDDQSGEIAIRTSKRDTPIRIPMHPLLVNALRHQTKAAKGVRAIAVNLKGKAWTADGFDAVWHRLKKRLEAAGEVQPGLTLHGLRHTLGTLLYEAGLDDGRIADILGQSSISMARHYSRHARLPAHARGIVAGLKLVDENEDDTSG
jgi:integrase